MSKIKYALIGFGGIAENRIAKEGFACDRARFQPLDEVELVGACDLNPARKEAAEKLGLRWYDSADAILNDPEIQAVFIATNNLSHASMATKALEAGKHVIVEKPLAATAEDGQKLLDLAAAKKLSLAVDHMMVYNHLNVKAKEIVQSDQIGTVNDSCFHMEVAYGFDPAEAATWRCNNQAEMGGPIGDVASHCFYMAEFMFNDTIKEVAAVYLPKTLAINVENGAYIKFKLSGGMTGSVKVAFSELRGGLGGTLTNLGFEIYGATGALRSYGTMFQLSGYEDEPIEMRLELDSFDAQECFYGTGSEDSEVPNIYQGVILHHARSIADGTAINADDGLRNVKQCLAAHKSAANGGQWVAID